MNGNLSHKSVLADDTLAFLAPSGNKIIVDGTLGFGGHAERILERLGPGGRLVGIDRDAEALESAKERLGRFGDRAVILKDDYRNLPDRLKKLGIGKVQGILLDLGVSSMQLDEPARGFSFSHEGPLDMRMDKTGAVTAKEVVNRFPQRELEALLWRLGEERFSRRIAKNIAEKRQQKPLETTAELASLISQSVPPFYRHGRIHPATRSFQAIRMFVNQELEALESFLAGALECLDRRARLVIISFHSLEDRAVKHAFRDWKKRGLAEILTKKPLTASPEEIRGNPRSRSAKLRALKIVKGAAA